MTTYGTPWPEPSVERDRVERITDALYELLSERRVKSADRFLLAEELAQAAVTALDSASDDEVVGEPFDPRGYFVYVLWSESPRQPMYVGCSVNILARLGTHWGQKKRRDVMNRVEVIRCRDRWEMDQLEARLIRRYRPPLNVVRYGITAD